MLISERQSHIINMAFFSLLTCLFSASVRSNDALPHARVKKRLQKEFTTHDRTAEPTEIKGWGQPNRGKQTMEWRNIERFQPQCKQRVSITF